MDGSGTRSPRSQPSRTRVNRLERQHDLVLSSNSVVGQRMAASFSIEFPDGIVDGLIEVFRSGEGLVSEVMPLQVAPENLDIVQLRSVFRQPLDREPVGTRREGRP